MNDDQKLERLQAEIKLEKRLLRRNLEKWRDAVIDYYIILRWTKVFRIRYKLAILLLKMAERLGKRVTKNYNYRRKADRENPPRLWFVVKWLADSTKRVIPRYKKCGVRLMGEKEKCTKPLITPRNIRYGRCEFHLMAEHLRRALVESMEEKTSK